MFTRKSAWEIVSFAHSGMTTLGSAQAVMKVTHIKKAREAHQITAAVLHALLLEAYEKDYPDFRVPLDDWIRETAQISPTFHYWLTVLNLEILLMTFVRAVRQGQFVDFVDALKQMAPWYFLMDHHNYARWLSIHIMDLKELERTQSAVFQQFQCGKFVVHNTGRSFSALGVDHAHEQMNATVKGSGGAIGLTDDASSLRRWTVGGPEVSRLLEEFEIGEKKQEGNKTVEHHEQVKWYQARFLDKCQLLREGILQYENPFSMKVKELVAIDSRAVAGERGVETLKTIKQKGTTLFKAFVKDRLIEKTISVYDPIPKVKTTLFKIKSQQKAKITAELKSEVSLFSRLFIVSTARNLNLNSFFEHENQSCPPSISINGMIRSGNKAQLLQVLEKYGTCDNSPILCDAIIFDGAALAHNIRPQAGCRNFGDYGNQIVTHVTHLARDLSAKRVDIVWDLYNTTSLKAFTRNSRGCGTRRQDLPNKGAPPSDWMDYLRNDCNKQELFRFLANFVIEYSTGVQVISNVDSKIESNKAASTSLEGFSCHMEEADGRMILHLQDAVIHGLKNSIIVTSDTDVVVLAVSFFYELRKNGLSELWIRFGTGRNKRFINVGQIAEALGEDKSIALRGFHAFTGCDTMSLFFSKSKRSAWAAWKEDEATQAFMAIALPMTSMPEEALIGALEKFVSHWYGDISGNVNLARKRLFCTEGKPLAAIPPTRGALSEHIKRSAYQAGHIWGRANKANEEPPSPKEWGWTLKEEEWAPVWSMLPPIWEACRELDKCGCKSTCETLRCLCRRNNLPCTLACKHCQEKCKNNSYSLETSIDDNEEI